QGQQLLGFALLLPAEPLGDAPHLDLGSCRVGLLSVDGMRLEHGISPWRDAGRLRRPAWLMRYVIAYTASRYPEVGSEIETGDVRRRQLAPLRCARRRLDPRRDGDRPRVAVGCGGRHPGR